MKPFVEVAGRLCQPVALNHLGAQAVFLLRGLVPDNASPFSDDVT